ncbi:hypothetical protein QQZ08_002800 [Neonectria magnoliae]|uniref:Uncharacterized protein n=1 Tax=Neonectria magnoliae TaxID=2732573 RepID=A0ABR1ID41_9HYPO
MSWTETIVQEMMRLTNWPIQSLKHDDFTQYFLDRKALDDCKPKLSYAFSDNVFRFQLRSPLVPSPLKGSVTADQVGTEPPIQWVTLSGSPVTLALGKPIAF